MTLLLGGRCDHADHLLIKSLESRLAKKCILRVLIVGATINMVGKMPYHPKISLLKIETCPEISLKGKFCTNQDSAILDFSKS